MIDLGDTSSPGLLGSIKRLGVSLLGIVQTRLELLSIELEQEKQRAVALIVWALAASFAAILAILMFSVAVILLTPADLRAYVIAGFCLLYALIALGATLRLRRLTRDQPAPLSDSIAEIRKDLSWLKSDK